MSRHQIAPDATIAVPLEALTTIWVDWYNADYTIHNWVTGVYPGWSAPNAYPRPKIDIAAADDRYYLSSAARDTFRSVLLDGGGLSSTWKATIDNAPASMNGSHVLKLRKDFLGEYTFTNTSGDIITKHISYKIFNDDPVSNSFSVTVEETATDAHLALLYFNQAYPAGAHKSRDSLVGFFWSANDPVLVIRQ
jgi:hypothetical protein